VAAVRANLRHSAQTYATANADKPQRTADNPL